MTKQTKMTLKISLRINYLYYPDTENTNMSIKNG